MTLWLWFLIFFPALGVLAVFTRAAWLARTPRVPQRPKYIRPQVAITFVRPVRRPCCSCAYRNGLDCDKHVEPDAESYCAEYHADLGGW